MLCKEVTAPSAEAKSEMSSMVLTQVMDTKDKKSSSMAKKRKSRVQLLPRVRHVSLYSSFCPAMVTRPSDLPCILLMVRLSSLCFF
jgi:hypothetical protein